MKNMYEYITHIEQNYTKEIAFRFLEEDVVKEITFEKYVTDVKKMAGYLQKCKKQADDLKIGILSQNNYRAIVIWVASILAGVKVVPLNNEEALDVITYQMQLTKLSTIYTDGTYSEREAAFGTNFSDKICMISEIYDEICTQTNDTSYYIYEENNIDETCMYLFTSGTTGKSKGVELSQRNLFSPMKRFLPDPTRESYAGQNAFLVVPMYHIAGIVMFLPWNYSGATIQICQSPMYVYKALKKMPSDFTFVVPAILKSFYKDLKKGKVEKLGGLKTILCGGAFVDPELFSIFTENGIRIIQAYALTETCGKGTINYSTDLCKSGSIGKADEEVNIQIIEDEICFHGDPITKGYYLNEQATTEAIIDGIFHTGDLGYIDEDGYVYLTGRKKNLIILSGGENVNPEELEEKIATCIDVKEILVFETDDKICGEIYANPGCEGRIEEHIKQINTTLPGFKRITKVIFREEPFDKTATGKIKRS